MFLEEELSKYAFSMNWIQGATGNVSCYESWGYKNQLTIGGSWTGRDNPQEHYTVVIMCSELIKHVQQWMAEWIEDTGQLNPTT